MESHTPDEKPVPGRVVNTSQCLTTVESIKKDKKISEEEDSQKEKSHPKESPDKSHIKRVRCEFCDKLFNVRYMVRHMRVHTGEKPYKCEVCGKSFAVNVNLVTHMRSHTGERPFHCEFCDKTFTTNGNRATHMRLHTGYRPYKCELCGNAFNTKPNLDTHMRTHTGERPYQCQICPKAFSHRSHLVKHMKVHLKECMGSMSEELKSSIKPTDAREMKEDPLDETEDFIDINADSVHANVKVDISQLRKSKLRSKASKKTFENEQSLVTQT